MQNTKKTLLFVTLMSVFTTNVMPRSVEIGSISVNVEDIKPAASWLSGVASSGFSVLKSAFTGVGKVGASALTKGAIPMIGTAIASSFLPFGLGAVVKAAAPYVLSAGAEMLSKKITGNDDEEAKYRAKIRQEIRRATRKYRKARSISRSRGRRRSFRPRYEVDEYDDFDDDCYVDDDDCELEENF